MAGIYNAGSIVYEVDMETAKLIEARRELDAALNGLGASMGKLEASINRTEKSLTGSGLVSTNDFVRELAKFNHHFTHLEANRWIEYHQTSFYEKSDDGKGNRVFLLRNMGYVR